MSSNEDTCPPTTEECERVAAALERLVVKEIARLREAPGTPGATRRAVEVIGWLDAAAQVRALAALLGVLLALIGCDGRAAAPLEHGPASAPPCPVDASSGAGGAEPAERAQRSFYARPSESQTGVAGDALVAVAACDPGDVAVLGSCRWGKRPGTVAPHEQGPALAPDDTPIGWRCEGVATERADGASPGIVYALAVCEVAP